MDQANRNGLGWPLDVVPGDPSRTPWAIILAGGGGRRMQAAIFGWFGEDRPKQFCTFFGERSLLQRTIDRAATVIAPRRIVCVIREGQERWFASSVDGSVPVHRLVLPGDVGTGGAVFAALAAISEVDPGATVLVLPSDHHVDPDRAFAREAVHACMFAEHTRDRIVHLAARADAPETDYGWIGAGNAQPSALSRFLGREPSQVRHFVEKPTAEMALRLLRRGYLWNTGVTAARAETLWSLGRTALGPAVRPFEALGRLLGTVRREGGSPADVDAAVRRAFDAAVPFDFSGALCQQPAVARAALVLLLRGVTWSDLGRPERVTAVLSQAMFRPTDAPAGSQRSWGVGC